MNLSQTSSPNQQSNQTYRKFGTKLEQSDWSILEGKSLLLKSRYCLEKMIQLQLPCSNAALYNQIDQDIQSLMLGVVAMSPDDDNLFF